MINRDKGADLRLPSIADAQRAIEEAYQESGIKAATGKELRVGILESEILRNVVLYAEDKGWKWERIKENPEYRKAIKPTLDAMVEYDRKDDSATSSDSMVNIQAFIPLYALSKGESQKAYLSAHIVAKDNDQTEININGIRGEYEAFTLVPGFDDLALFATGRGIYIEVEGFFDDEN